MLPLRDVDERPTGGLTSEGTSVSMLFISIFLCTAGASFIALLATDFASSVYKYAQLLLQSI